MTGKPFLLEKQSKQKQSRPQIPRSSTTCTLRPEYYSTRVNDQPAKTVEKPTLEKKRFGESSGNPLCFASRYRWESQSMQPRAPPHVTMNASTMHPREAATDRGNESKADRRLEQTKKPCSKSVTASRDQGKKSRKSTLCAGV